MDITEFIEYVKENKLESGVCNGMKNSNFGSKDVDFGGLIEKQIKQQPSNNFVGTQAGIPNYTKNAEKNKNSTFSSNFGESINNLYSLFISEFARKKVCLNQTNALIEDLINTLEHENEHMAFINKINKINNLNAYENEITLICEKYYNKIHQKIINEKSLSLFSSLKESFINKISSVYKNLPTEDIIIDNVEEFILTSENTESYINICYKGSFLKLVYELYLRDKTSCVELIKKHKISRETEIIKEAISIHVKNVLIRINKLLKANIIISDEFINEFVLMIINYFILLSEQINTIHNIHKTFEKNTRVQFSLILAAISLNKPNNYVLTKSQLAIIHYVLLSDKQIKKMLQ